MSHTNHRIIYNHCTKKPENDKKYNVSNMFIIWNDIYESDLATNILERIHLINTQTIFS